jgi:cation transport ATPase
MERIGGVATVFFDKTGTVTEGRPAVTAVESLDPALGADEVLAALAALESASEHTLARAIVAEARRRGIDISSPRDVQVFPGQGLRGEVPAGGAVYIVTAGTEGFVETNCGLRIADCELENKDKDHRIPPSLAVQSAIRNPQSAIGLSSPVLSDATVVYVAWAGRVRGRVFLADAVRPGAAEAVRRLRGQGVAVALLSGDRAEAARAVAAEIGIERVEAPRRPQEKIAALRAESWSPFGLTMPPSAVAMVGDGINDAPALAAADVGIALGAGTDLARQSGHVVLLSDRLMQIPWLIALSRRTRTIIRQNLAWAFGYNAIALAAAAAGVLHPLLAAVAMVVSSLTVLANSLRLQRFPDA